MKDNKLGPYLAVAIGVLAVSTSAIFDQACGCTTIHHRFLSFTFSGCQMLPLILWKYRDEFIKITKQDWLYTAAAGVFLAFHFIFWFESLELTSVASSTVLVTTQPIFAFIGTYIFFKERFTSGAVFSMLIALTGSFIISWGDFQISGMALFGNFLALMGGRYHHWLFLIRPKCAAKVVSCNLYIHCIWLHDSYPIDL